MMRGLKLTAFRATILLALAALIAPVGAAPVETPAEQQVAAEKQMMMDLGLQQDTSWDLYLYLKEQARGGSPLSWDNMPDWTGLWVKTPSEGLAFDPDQPQDGLPTAKLTPEAHTRMMETIERVRQGLEYDPISDCRPPGFPRWLGIPFLREHIVTPDQTWFTSETVNNVRRVYTDGREHLPEEDRYPLYYGDSIGFWDGHKLVIHTNQLRAGIYTRAHPDYSDQVETVEIWEKVSDSRIEVDVWVYDPPILVEPWYVKHSYTKVPNADQRLRIRYWHCSENPNNVVIETEEGRSDFLDFTFTDADNP